MSMEPDLAAFGGVAVSIFRNASGPGRLMFRTDSRMICRIVFRKAFRKSAVLKKGGKRVSVASRQCDQTFCEKKRPILPKYRPKRALLGK
jgi:hypothetical protein